jgi:methyltransferase (TIGR00027 family)
MFKGAMQAGRFSRTAQVMALFRALETARPPRSRLLNDRFATTVLPASLRGVVALSRFPLLATAISAVVDSRWPGARTSGIARTRLIDDWTSAAAQDGVCQLAILGAGFDSRAWRLPVLAGTRVFEVDHPATSAEKQRRLAVAGLDPTCITRVAIDFDQDLLGEALEKAGFDPRCRSFIIWEGVTNYLTEGAVDRVLRWAGTLAAGSQLAFTYVHAGVLREPNTFEGAERILAAVGKAGEAWTYGIEPSELPDHLQALGLTLIEDLGADDYRDRYRRSTDAQRRGYAFYRAALALVPERAETRPNGSSPTNLTPAPTLRSRRPPDR